MIDLNLSGQRIGTREEEMNYSQPVSIHHHSISIWPHKSVNNPQINNLSTTTPDLDLKLATPKQIDENKSSESHHLTGPISVV